MKKKLTFLFAFLTLILGGVNAQKTETLDANSAPESDKAAVVLESVTVGPNGELTAQSAGDYLKVRTGNSKNTLTLNVNEGYKVTGISIEAYSNNKSTEADRSITLTGISADDGANLLTESVVFPGGTAGQTPATAAVSGFEATSKIVLSFDNSNITSDDSAGKNKQIMAKITLTFEGGEEAADADLKVEVVDYPTSAAEDADVVIKAKVTNNGSATETNISVWALVNGTTWYGAKDAKIESLAAGASEEVTITLPEWYSEKDANTIVVRANVKDEKGIERAHFDSEEFSIGFVAEPELEVTISDAPKSVVADQNFTVTGRVTNTGSVDLTGIDVVAIINGQEWSGSTTKIESLEKGGEYADVTVNVNEIYVDGESFTLKLRALIKSGDSTVQFESDETTIAYSKETSEFGISAIKAPETVSDATFDVTVIVNAPEAVDGAKVTLNIPGYYTDEQTVALKAGENEVTFTVDVDKAKLKAGTEPYELSAWVTVDGEEYYYNDEENGAVKVVVSYTTGIARINAAINSGEAVYNLNGQRVSKTTKGIVIINGKKVYKK